MRRIIVTEGDGKPVVRVAKQYVATARINVDAPGDPYIGVLVHQDGHFSVTVRDTDGSTHVLAQGELFPWATWEVAE